MMGIGEEAVLCTKSCTHRIEICLFFIDKKNCVSNKNEYISMISRWNFFQSKLFQYPLSVYYLESHAY